MLKALANGSGAAGMALGCPMSRERLEELALGPSVSRKRAAELSFRSSVS